METFSVSIAFVKTHQAIQLKMVDFAFCTLYLHKPNVLKEKVHLKHNICKLQVKGWKKFNGKMIIKRNLT